MVVIQLALILLLLAGITATAPSIETLLGSSRDYTGGSMPARVIFDHDGGVDDFITLMLLLSQPSKVEVLVSSTLNMLQQPLNMLVMSQRHRLVPSKRSTAHRFTACRDHSSLVNICSNMLASGFSPLLLCYCCCRMQGITIVEGDCIADIAVNTTVKLLHLLGRQHIPVALSTLKAANPFPDRYRQVRSLPAAKQQ